MEGILNFLFIYIFIILLWTVINLILFTSSYLLRKNLSSFILILNYLIDVGINFYLIGYALYVLWQIIIAKLWLLLILALIFGVFIIEWWRMIYSFLLAPFHLISIFFTTKAQESIDRPRKEFEGEYISPEGKVIGKFQSEDKTNSLLAKWFIISFGTLFLYQFSPRVNNEGIGLGWFVLSPMIVMIILFLVIALFLGIWNLLKYKSFFRDNKRIFIYVCLKIIAIIYGFFLVTDLIFQ